MSDALLRLSGIACMRGGRLLLRGIDLTLTPGQSALLRGPNGTGKSSLIRLTAGLLPAYAGTIERRGKVALSDEALALDRDRTLGRALGFWAKMDAVPASAVADALNAIGLSDLADIPMRMLSTGQRKRAMLARVAASGAPIWLLDEPANGLDSASAAMLGALMRGHLARGGIILAASHQDLPLDGAQDIDLSAYLPQEEGCMILPALIARDSAQAWRSGGLWLPLAFLLLVAALFPFAVGPDAALLSRTGGGMLWIAALLASLLPVDRLVAPDRDAGVLDQLALRGIGDELVALAKLVAHWISFGPPLMLAAFPAAALLKLDGQTLLHLEIGLALGTPALAALGLLIAALTAGLRSSGALAGLLALPLAIPLLIFGAGSLDDQSGAAFKFLAAVSLLLISITPFAAGAAIRAGRE